jgi:hypothetical protein
LSDKRIWDYLPIIARHPRELFMSIFYYLFGILSFPLLTDLSDKGYLLHRETIFTRRTDILDELSTPLELDNDTLADLEFFERTEVCIRNWS